MSNTLVCRQRSRFSLVAGMATGYCQLAILTIVILMTTILMKTSTTRMTTTTTAIRHKVPATTTTLIWKQLKTLSGDGHGPFGPCQALPVDRHIGHVPPNLPCQLISLLSSSTFTTRIALLFDISLFSIKSLFKGLGTHFFFVYSRCTAGHYGHFCHLRSIYSVHYFRIVHHLEMHGFSKMDTRVVFQ